MSKQMLCPVLPSHLTECPLCKDIVRPSLDKKLLKPTDWHRLNGALSVKVTPAGNLVLKSTGSKMVLKPDQLLALMLFIDGIKTNG